MARPEKIWKLIARSLNNEASESERAELYYYMQEDPELKSEYNFLKENWHSSKEERNLPEVSGNLNRIFQKAAGEQQQLVSEPIREVERSFLIRRYSKYGIAASLIIGVTFFWYKHLSPAHTGMPVKEQVIAAQNGSRTRALLPDGSTVWLNAGSKLMYKSNFKGKNRVVTLEGEAFFDIVSMPEKPFIVHLGAMDIKVLGTAFNVKNYKQDNIIETTLLRGSIEVISNRKEERIKLKPNQKLLFEKTENADVEPIIAADQVLIKTPEYQLGEIKSGLKENERLETAWVYNRIEFRGETFVELAEKLERWYDVEIHFEDEDVKKLKFNGSFEKETINQAFDALREVASFEYKLKEREIFIKSSN
ncbi:FecR family protein [Desertivirga brevis]|uniref:FecR family protein n=1 Tax=Desertivirga brevis TaxID=2810310 RepID=UPI001A95AA98|nr:FecR domain-containing protein [Pedobacter sp. SYSU D00873]